MKRTGKRVNIAITGVIAALYLLSLLVLLVHNAYDIQASMQAEAEQICINAAEAVVALVSEDELENTRKEQLFRYQQVMADNELGLSGTYPFRCVSALGGTDWTEGGMQMPVYSRNAIFVKVTWENGITEQIPMVFAHENSADVAQVLWYSHILESKVTGYWQDGFFYVQKIASDQWSNADYESPLEAPEESKLEQYEIVPLFRASASGTRSRVGNARNVEITTAMKCYGGNSQMAPFVKRWEADDALLQELIADGFGINGASRAQMGPLTEIKERTIFNTKLKVRERMKDYTELCGAPYMYVAFMAEFSPLELAAGELWGGWVPVVFLGVFALAWLFLNTTYNFARQQEVRAYQDEITRQTQALEYAQNAEKSRREMTSAIAHELKTPIAILSSYAEALQENIDAEKQEHYLSVIRDETGKMDRMVLELLDLSRLEAGKYKLQREQFDLEELSQKIIEPLMPQIEKKNIVLTWQVGQSMVNADRCRLGQVIENFMTNAIRHTPEGGKIVLRIGMDRETFSVENQGKHIPSEQLSKVWETFWQGDASRNERGSGLGLAICRTIVSLHGGSCKVENTNAGVKFSISLSAERKLYQLGRMAREEIVELTYPIARWSTTVERVLERLELLRGRALNRELKAGNIYLGDEVVTEKQTKLYAGYTISWREFRITVIQDDDEKRRALLLDRMRQGSLGYLDATKIPGWIGNPN